MDSNFSVNLSGQAAIVTGAGVGIGRAIALELAKAGAGVLVNDINPDRAETVTQMIRAAGGRAEPFQADISNRFQSAAMIEKTRDAFGRVHILVNAAGTYKGGQMLKVDEYDWRRILEVNLTGAFFCTQLLGRVMSDEGGGTIINLASAIKANSEGVAFAASKAGLVALTQQAALEYAAFKVRVNAVCPVGVAEDDMPQPDVTRIPQGRAGTPDDVANVVLFLCSEAASFITGQVVVIDGGASLL